MAVVANGFVCRFKKLRPLPSFSLSPSLFHSLSPSLSPLVLLPLSGRPNEAEGRRSARAHALVHYASRSLMLGKTKQAISLLSLLHISAKCLQSGGVGGWWGGDGLGARGGRKTSLTAVAVYVLHVLGPSSPSTVDRVHQANINRGGAKWW